MVRQRLTNTSVSDLNIVKQKAIEPVCGKYAVLPLGLERKFCRLLNMPDLPPDGDSLC